jgi:hypothetical protein
MRALSKYSMEQWVLAGAFFGLGLILAAKAFLMPSADEGNVFSEGKMAEAYDPQVLIESNQSWGQFTPLAIDEKHSIYVSRLIVYKPAENVVEWLDPESSIGDIRVSWLLANGYSLEDPTVPEQDTDRDGFNTLEEFQAETQPRDRQSHPPFIVKLCLKEYEYIAFRLIFRGYSQDASGEGMVYQINLKDAPRRRTRLVRKGDNVEGYTIGEFREIKQERISESTGVTEVINLSELEVINPKLDEKIILILNKEQESDESRVVFDIPVPDLEPQPAEVQRGDSFELAGKTYQLISASRESATIKNTDTGEEITVARCETEEVTPAPSILFE